MKVRGGERIGELATLVDPGTGVPPQHRRAHRHHHRAWSRGAPRARRRAAVAAGVPRRRGAGGAQRPVRRRVPARRLQAPRAAVAAAAGALHGAARPGRAVPRRGARACGWARWPGCSAPHHPPTTGRSPTPGPPSRCCTACSSGSATSGCRASRSCSRWRATRRRTGPPRRQRRKRHLAEAVPSAPGVYLFRGAARRGALRRHERRPAAARAQLLHRGRAAPARPRHGGAGRAGRHRRVRARAGGGGARAAADRGPPAPLQPPLPRTAPRRGGSPPRPRRSPGCRWSPHRGRARSARSARGRRPCRRRRRCSTPCRCGPAPSASRRTGRRGQPVRAARAGALRRPVRRAADTGRVRARRRRRGRPVRGPRRRRAAAAAHHRSTATPTASGSRRRPACAIGSPRSCVALGRAQRLAALAGRRGDRRRAAGRVRRLGARGGAPRPARRRRGRRARRAADAGDRRAADGAQVVLPGPGPLRGAPAEEIGLLHRWLTTRRHPARARRAAVGRARPQRRGAGRGGRSAPGRSWWTPCATWTRRRAAARQRRARAIGARSHGHCRAEPLRRGLRRARERRAAAPLGWPL